MPLCSSADTALEVVAMVEKLVDSGLPQAVVDSLMKSRVGGAKETLDALVRFQGSPDQLEPILEDIADNYRNFFQGAAGRMDDFLALFMPRRGQQGSGSNPLLSMLSQLPVIGNRGSTNGGFAPPEIAGDSTPPPGSQA
ncbi:hypothetical protein ElyMa_003582800 [Elysia marginata]|uniref:Uncharacterized protein n=1 Tax=Elysia marginata TaxID=1093978 RepID=A0AAV4ENY6_9GAST|nr:hypothetical protein ElyMa_003582800 [Elysia marginata]